MCFIATLCTIVVVVPLLYRGTISAIATVGTIDGFISAMAWFASAIVPLYYLPTRHWQAVS